MSRTCPSCGAPLTDPVPASCPSCRAPLAAIPADGPVHLVTVARYDNPPLAEAARLHLAEAGIPAVLADADIVGMDWLLANAIGHVKVQVPAARAEEALRVLRETLPAPSPDSDEDEDEDEEAEGEDDGDACLSCGRMMPDSEPRCPHCGWTFQQSDDAAEAQAPEPAPTAGETAGLQLMKAFRAAKKPALMLLLAPVLAALTLGVIGVVLWILGWLLGPW